MNIVESEGVETVSRVEFAKDLLAGVKEGLSELFILPMVVDSVSPNQVTYKVDLGEDGIEEEVVNLNDEDDLELLFTTYIVLGSATLTEPEIVVHFSEKAYEETQEFIVDGLELHDFSGKIISAGDLQGTLKVKLGANYLRNLLRMNGIISTSNTDEKPKNLVVEKSESQRLNEYYKEVFESDTYSLAGLKSRQRTKKLRLKKIQLNRRTDRAGFLKRSKAAKLRWRTSRAKILRGMKKFHRSADGKRLHTMLGKLNEK